VFFFFLQTRIFFTKMIHRHKTGMKETTDEEVITIK